MKNETLKIINTGMVIFMLVATLILMIVVLDKAKELRIGRPDFNVDVINSYKSPYWQDNSINVTNPCNVERSFNNDNPKYQSYCVNIIAEVLKECEVD